MLLIGMQWIFHCFQVQIDSVGVFVWALAPFLCFGVFLLFASLFPLAKRKSGWGICGSSLFVWLLFLCFASIDLLISRTLRPCTEVFAAYSHVRTEPLARHRPHSRKKNQRGPSRGIVGRHSLRRKITTPCHCHGSGIEWSALPEKV